MCNRSDRGSDFPLWTRFQDRRLCPADRHSAFGQSELREPGLELATHTEGPVPHTVRPQKGQRSGHLIRNISVGKQRHRYHGDEQAQAGMRPSF